MCVFTLVDTPGEERKAVRVCQLPDRLRGLHSRVDGRHQFVLSPSVAAKVVYGWLPKVGMSEV